ncbi:hypothetical protein L228DRAFT_259871 [Xylona heveae TC161]|uniref:Uncharacterized protein n=1 Tax=Xylona heveae (strain CBS 132557 / TC161) TaxID=1328760 RepID=A0A165IBY6_XYLHT|nr:hypothetical protein L228DRAFT_259871 [Xylona heveae TC161]KZF24688.1 hypothetical protein L228DRAFT_259871 [Xylona heveae TC161]
MLPPFRIQRLWASENPSGPDFGDDFTSSPPSYDENMDIIHISESVYDNILSRSRDAALRYMDEDDGEIVTIGSSLELVQRLDEPLPRWMRSSRRSLPGAYPNASPAAETPAAAEANNTHVFEINRTNEVIEIWRTTSATAKGLTARPKELETPEEFLQICPAKVDDIYDKNTTVVNHEDPASMSDEPLDNERSRYFEATEPPLAQAWSLSERSSEAKDPGFAREEGSEPEQDELARETTPLLRHVSPKPVDDTPLKNLTAQGHRLAQEAGQKLRSHTSHAMHAVPTNLPNSETEMAQHHNRWASYGKQTSSFDAPEPLPQATTSESDQRPLLELFEAELSKLTIEDAGNININPTRVPSTENETQPSAAENNTAHTDTMPQPMSDPAEVVGFAVKSMVDVAGLLANELKENLPHAQEQLARLNRTVPHTVEHVMRHAMDGFSSHLQNLAHAAQDASQSMHQSAAQGIGDTSDTPLEGLKTVALGISQFSRGLLAMAANNRRPHCHSHGARTAEVNAEEGFAGTGQSSTMHDTPSPQNPQSNAAFDDLYTVTPPRAKSPTPREFRVDESDENSTQTQSANGGESHLPARGPTSDDLPVDDKTIPPRGHTPTHPHGPLRRSRVCPVGGAHFSPPRDIRLGSRHWPGPRRAPCLPYEYVVPPRGYRSLNPLRPSVSFANQPRDRRHSRSPPFSPAATSTGTGRASFIHPSSSPRHGPIRLPDDSLPSSLYLGREVRGRDLESDNHPFRSLKNRRPWHPGFQPNESRPSPGADAAVTADPVWSPLRPTNTFPSSAPAPQPPTHAHTSRFGFNDEQINPNRPVSLDKDAALASASQDIDRLSQLEMSRFPSLSQFEKSTNEGLPRFPPLPSMETLIPQNYGKKKASKNPFSSVAREEGRTSMPQSENSRGDQTDTAKGKYQAEAEPSAKPLPPRPAELGPAKAGATLAGPFDPLFDGTRFAPAAEREARRRGHHNHSHPHPHPLGHSQSVRILRPHGAGIFDHSTMRTRRTGSFSGGHRHGRGDANDDGRNDLINGLSAPQRDHAHRRQPLHINRPENEPIRDPKVRDCLNTLKALGFDSGLQGGAERLTIYAQAANGDLEEAMDMIEEEKRAYEQRGPRLV